MSPAIDHLRVLANSQFDHRTIIYLSLTVSFIQMMIIFLLAFKTPFQHRLIAVLDELKRGKAQLVVKSISAIVFVLMIYNVYSVLEIGSRSVDAVDSPNYVVLVYRMFEASVMGFSLILLVTIDGLHEYIKEVVVVTEAIQVAKKQKRAYENCMKKNADEAEIMRKDISRLKAEITKLECECSMKEQAVQLERAEVSTLKDTLEASFEKYDRLLVYNKDLKEQLQGVNERLSCSDSKKSVFFSWDRWGL